MTQSNWKRVSKRAKARPRATSVPSRCTRLSNASRPHAEAAATAVAAAISAPRPYDRAAKTSGTLGTTSEPARIHSSRTRFRWARRFHTSNLPRFAVGMCQALAAGARHGSGALRLLRDEGLLEFRRRRGITVAGTSERGAVLARARELVAFARRQGYRRKELIQIIETLAD